MVRRCLNEAMQVARHRRAFGRNIIEFPLLRRQLMKIMVPTEQALSMFLFAGHIMEAANKGDAKSEELLRVLTPLLKFRACRDNISVATGAMEIRGGNGYIEDWVNPRLIRDAQVGLLWEGTSNNNALDVVTRAVGKVGAHRRLQEVMQDKLAEAKELSDAFRQLQPTQLDRAIDFAEKVARDPAKEDKARLVVNALYHTAASVLLACEGAASGAGGQDARRLLLSRLVLDHRVLPHDPMDTHDNGFDVNAANILLSDEPVSLREALQVLAI